MTSRSIGGSDPFTDEISVDEHDLVAESTLFVGRNATLTLATDGLIVLGMSIVLIGHESRLTEYRRRPTRPAALQLLRLTSIEYVACSASVTRRD